MDKTINAIDNTISSPGKFKVLAYYYNNDTRSDKPYDSEIDRGTGSTDPDYANVYVYGGLNNSRWKPCISLEYSGNTYDDDGNTTGGFKIGEGFDCKFKSETTFMDDGDYRGCIAFTWTNKSLGEDAVPEYTYGSNYNIALENDIDTVRSITGNINALPTNGLLGGSLAEYGSRDNNFKGFSISLYSSKDFNEEAVPYTTKLSHYIITYINSKENGTDNNQNSISYFGGELPRSDGEPYDVYYNENTISVYPTEDAYSFYLNGTYIASIERDQLNIDSWGENEGFFTASMIATSLTDASITITEINNNGGNLMIYEHINNNKYLTTEEKKNLCNLATSVKAQGAYGDGAHDDTAAFVNALRENSRVYVPGGTYKITGELVVRDNCELELAQDAVLEFDFSANSSGNGDDSGTTATADGGTTGGTNTEVGIEPWSDEKIIAAKKCITLNMLSSLVGNHATIRVTDDFDGIVIYASTRSHPDRKMFKDIFPFKHYCPQWKPARYVTNVNIVKPNIDGVHASKDGACSGIGVLVEGYRRDKDADGNAGSTYIWGLEYTGLRIAGAFNYGVYGTNYYNETDDDWAWTNDMKINGLIEGCEVGVYLYHCDYAYISTLIQPRPATNNAMYAKYGIFLNECQYVDLTGSRVWDWDEDHTLGGALLDKENLVGNKVYKHIGLRGNCKGLMLDDYYYYRLSEFNIRDLIYNEYAPNYDNMTILQEPASKFFNVDVEAIEPDPVIEDGEGGGNTEPISEPSSATEIKGRLFVDRTTAENTGELTTAFGKTTTGMIPCDSISTVTVTGFDFSNDNESIIAFYDENYTCIHRTSVSTFITGNGEVVPTDDDGSVPPVEDDTQEDISVTLSFAAVTNPKYFRISCKTDCIADIPRIFVGIDTIVFPCTCLKDHIYIKAKYIDGLDERIQAILAKMPN